MALASGVPLGAFTWTPPGSPSPARPIAMNGTRLWLCRLGSPIGEPIQHDGLVEQRAVAIRGRRAQLLQEIGQLAHMIGVDLRQLEDALFTIAVMRRVVERPFEPALRIRAIGPVAAQSLNVTTRVASVRKASTCRSNISRTCSENESGMPGGAAGNSRTSPLMFRASTILDAPARSHARWSGSRRAGRDRRRQATASAAGPSAASRSRMRRFCRAADRPGPLDSPTPGHAGERVEDRARVAHHRQRLVRRRPAERVDVAQQE